MPNLNKVMLMGNLTKDPLLSYLPSQTPIAEFGLAVNRTWTGQDGVKKEEVTFVDCTAFGKAAELLNQYKRKGDPLFVEGRLKLDQWEAQDGSKRSKMRVVVETFQFLNRSGGPGGGGEGGDEGERPSGAGAGRGSRQAGGGEGGGRGYRNTPSRGRSGSAPAKQTAPADDGGYSGEPGEDDGSAPIRDEDIPF
jgi:single-strand DNA-binding protein